MESLLWSHEEVALDPWVSVSVPHLLYTYNVGFVCVLSLFYLNVVTNLGQGDSEKGQ